MALKSQSNAYVPDSSNMTNYVSSKIRNAIYNIREKIYIHELTRKWGLFRGKKKTTRNRKNKSISYFGDVGNKRPTQEPEAFE